MNLTRDEVAAEIEKFLNGTGGAWDWDDFISIPLADADLEHVRSLCAGLPEEFPPSEPGHYCGPGGVAVLRSLLPTLRVASP